MLTDNETKLQALQEKGVILIDPRQVYIAPEVDIDRIFPQSILYPGTRLTGAKTLVGTGAKIGTEGPAVLSNAVVAAHAEIASGYLDNAVLLPRAKAGANSHYRPGTLLEEEASTAHCVGLKQSILMYGATLGSLINFCDVLMSGGHSRHEHSEVGSGFIHFNFTPWGKTGDKATPSMMGNVTEGVFLDQPKIFLGGMSGMVGPMQVGFGAMTVAGQVLRRPVAEQTMYSGVGKSFEREWSPTDVEFTASHLAKVRDRNIEFLVQLYSLKKWYLQVRLPRCKVQGDAELPLVYQAALDVIEACIKERLSRYNSFATEWKQPLLDKSLLEMPYTELTAALDWKPELAYDQWIWQLSETEKEILHGWLCADAAVLRCALSATK